MRGLFAQHGFVLAEPSTLNPKPGGLPAAAEAAGEEARGPLS